LVEVQYLLEFLLLWPIVALVRRLSEARSRAFARSLGRVAYRILAHDRRWCLRNLELVFGPNLTPGQRTKLALRAFEHIVLTRFEALRWTPEWMVANVIEEDCNIVHRVCREAAHAGTGCVLLSAHLGNFELLAPWSEHSGWPITVMYRPQNNWRVERLLAGARARFWPSAVPRGLFGLLKLRDDLQAGRAAGLLIDQNTIRHGVFVEFLGFRAASSPGPALLALETRAPVLLVVAVRQPDGRHRIIAHPPFPLIQTGDRQNDIAANTQQYARAIEPYVLAYPEQYNWPHPRWRYRPAGTFWKPDMPYEQMAAERSGPARERLGGHPVGTCRAA
jgi:KDO2-lipid IV(A) lauroyltransferase